MSFGARQTESLASACASATQLPTPPGSVVAPFLLAVLLRRSWRGKFGEKNLGCSPRKRNATNSQRGDAKAIGRTSGHSARVGRERSERHRRRLRRTVKLRHQAPPRKAYRGIGPASLALFVRERVPLSRRSCRPAAYICVAADMAVLAAPSSDGYLRNRGLSYIFNWLRANSPVLGHGSRSSGRALWRGNTSCRARSSSHRKSLSRTKPSAGSPPSGGRTPPRTLDSATSPDNNGRPGANSAVS